MAAFFLAIPTYWTYPGTRGAEEALYDHPTPLDTPGTLRRTLESLAPVVSPGIRVGVVAAAAVPELASRVEARVREVLDSPPLPFHVVFFSASHLAALQSFLRSRGREDWALLLSLSGYGAIRNVTLVLANLLEAEVLVSLDDDEVIQDRDFLQRIKADLATLASRGSLGGLAGVYLNPGGSLFIPEPEAPWALYWPKLRCMNDTIRELLGGPDPLPPTPLGLGGNLVLPAALYRRLPFDPLIPRGEDVDYVANARMFGIPFFLDGDLRVLHLPPEKPHPTWRRLRQDLVRFAYARRKLRGQEPGPGLTRVRPADLMPYPGTFLMDDLEERAYRSHTLLSLEYLAAGDQEGARQTLENLRWLHRESSAPENAFRSYLELAARWEDLQSWLARPEVAREAREALWGERELPA